MKRHFVCFVVVLVSWAAMAEFSKADWMFAPPIYKLPKPRPQYALQEPRPADGPYYTQPQGEFTTTSTRYLDSFINIQGRCVDNYMVTQSYTQHGSED